MSPSQMILETIVVGPMQANCYILAEDKGSPAVIIDPGAEEHKIKKVLDKHRLKPAFIINTHGHIDHIGCDDKFGVPVYIHSQDVEMLKNPALNLSQMFSLPFSIKSGIKTLKDNELIKLGKIKLKVIHTPGHTPGGISLLMQEPSNKILFSGDTLFFRSIGRTDFPDADENTLIKSIKERLLKLSDDTVVYTGHGPSSTIAEEKRNNPFLS